MEKKMETTIYYVEFGLKDFLDGAFRIQCSEPSWNAPFGKWVRAVVTWCFEIVPA